MKHIIVAIIAASLAACTAPGAVIKGDRDNKVVSVEWIKTNPGEAGPICLNKIPPGRLFSTFEAAPGLHVTLFPQGCATYGYKEDGSAFCRVISDVPREAFDVETFGHEVLHCFIGDYHN